MREKVADYIKRNHLISPGQGVVAGVSGGADSVALLHMLFNLSKIMGFRVYAAHLNHGIRGEAAAEDASFVRDLCDFYGVPVWGEYADVPSLAKQKGETLEQAGRTVRYDFLERARAYFGADKIAVAHHMDDQAESILLHLARGSGLLGLTGMQPERGRVIRPMLCLRRAEIEEYLAGEGLPYRTDETNLVPEGTRNRLRLDIIPYMENNINRALVPTLCSMGELLLRDEEYLNGEARGALERAKSAAGYLRAPLAALPWALKSRAIRLALGQAGAQTDIERVHVEAVAALLTGRTGARAELPGADVWTSYDLIFFGKYENTAPQWELPLGLTGETLTPMGSFYAEETADLTITADPYAAHFDADRLPGPLTVRTRRPGDRFYPLGAPGRRKLKQVLIDKKIPREKRELPLIAWEGEVLFMPGLGIGEEAKITKNTARVLRVKYKLENNRKE